jgi:hypothetical protein
VHNYSQQNVRPSKHKRGWLVAIGIVLLFATVMTGCGAVLMPVMLFLPQPQGQPPAQLPMTQLVMIALMYATVSAAFGWLGIGCLIKRRWSRPLTLILSTHWLIIGILSILSTLATYPIAIATIQADKTVPKSAILLILAAGLAIVAVVMVILPAAILLVMKSPDMRSTVEHYDPTPRWTDRCPIKVLGLSLTLYVTGLFFAFGIAYAAFPIAGVLLRGLPAILTVSIIAGLLILSGYWVYKLQDRGWWLGLLTISIVTLAMIPSVFFVPAVDFYRAMGTPEEQLPVIAEHEQLLKATFMGMMILFAIGFAAYMFSIRPLIQAARAKSLATGDPEQPQF